jgi:hypothetical protein
MKLDPDMHIGMHLLFFGKAGVTLGLFITPPLTHLRLLDCVEVQESSIHLEDHIQSIQVLNCSSLDLLCFVYVLSPRLSLELSECKVVPTLCGDS